MSPATLSHKKKVLRQKLPQGGSPLEEPIIHTVYRLSLIQVINIIEGSLLLSK